jgi:hypothetical protein
LGIAALEDKIVQQAVVTVLNQIYGKRQSNAPVRWSSCVLKLMDGQRT